MDTFNIYEAKTHLSQLVDRAAAGEEIVIAKAGTPVARLVPMPLPSPPKRQLGRFRDEIRIGDDFDDPLPAEIMDAFNGLSHDPE